MALDSLLIAAACQRDDIPPVSATDVIVEVPIPIALSGCGRVYLASFSTSAFETFEKQWTNQRFPVAEAQSLGGPKLRRIDLSTGPTKSYRIPREAGHLDHDRLDWFAIGDAEAARELLALIGYLGKKRSVGNGAVERWMVAPHEGWDGFPVVSPEGKPLRPLPLDWPGLVQPEIAERRLRPPYWHPSVPVEVCAVPEASC
jgi:CRISPR type IV-associated protein Csf3